MANNAYEVLASNFPALMPKLDANFSVSSMLQAYLTFMAHISAEERINITGLKAQVLIHSDRAREDGYFEAKIQIDVDRNEDALPVIKVDRQILWARNLVIARVLEVSASVRNLALQAVVEIEQWAAMHKIPWEDIRCAEKVIVRRGGRRLEIDLGQRQWLKDREEDLDVLSTSSSN